MIDPNGQPGGASSPLPPGEAPGVRDAARSLRPKKSPSPSLAGGFRVPHPRPLSRRERGGRRINPVWAWPLAVLAASGCSSDRKVAPSVNELPSMQVMHPELRRIVRVVGQPSFVQSYERTSIYPKMTGYIEKWNVDIGDRVQKGDVLADLFVPELREQSTTTKATVELDRERVRVAQKDVEVAASDVKASQAQLEETQSILGKYQAEVDRWRVQVDRIAREVDRQVIAPQILLESQNELKADIAARDAAQATIARAKADLQASEARLARSEVQVAAARAELSVAESEARRLEALVGYMKLLAPFDGIVVARNANTWDFVLPRTGDPTAMDRSPDLSPAQAAPIYVIDRTDIVRIFVDVPERDANYVHIGSTARVKIWAYRDEWLPASVARLSWALNTRSRTLRAEIDLPNSGSQILPAMYAYGKIVVDRPAVHALPKDALISVGGKSFFWRYEDGKARRTEVQTGIEEGGFVEVTNRKVPSDSPEDEQYVPIDGSEKVLVGSKLSTLTEGAEVRVSAEQAQDAGSTSASAPKSATDARPSE